MQSEALRYVTQVQGDIVPQSRPFQIALRQFMKFLAGFEAVNVSLRTGKP